MSRNAATHDAADENFASLLERLTRHASPATAKSGPDAYFESSADSTTASRAVSNTRAGIRPLHPVTEVKARSKAGRDADETDDMQLSYEKALRMHRRHKPVSNNNFDPPKIETPIETLIETLVDIGNKTTRASSGLSSPQLPAQPARNPKKKKTSGRSKKSSAKSGSNSRSGSRIQKEAQRSVILETIASQGTALTCRLQKIQSTDSKLDRIGQIDQIDPTGQLNPFDQLAQLTPPDQKRAIVSVRLTDSELATLRNRADESGISVSAYMRSCVLDAENLRAQVKQALAEMRSFSAKPEPVPLPLLPSPEDTRPANGGAWFQLLSRSAAFLLGPLFSFRRSA